MAKLPDNEIPAERLRELLRYDPDTGHFTRLTVRRKGRWRAGDLTGHKANARRYCLVSVDGEQYFAHRLAWLWMTGLWPTRNLDHINHCESDNRWGNLREATKSQNGANMHRHRDNITGVKGVYYDKTRKKFVAHLMKNRQVVLHKRFATIEDAHSAYVAKAKELFGEFHCAG